MITSLALKNFKGWKKAHLPLGRITVLFGTNSSGKTSILQSLLLLKQTAEGYDRSRPLHFGEQEKDLIELGSFEETVYGHSLKNEIGIELAWKPETPVDIGPGIQAEKIGYKGCFKSADEQVMMTHLKYTANEFTIEINREKNGTYSAVAKGIKSTGSKAIGPPESCYGIPHKATTYFKGLFPLEFSHQFESLMKSIRYLGPLRQPPGRVYPWSGSRPDSVGLKGEYAVQAMLAALKEKRTVVRRGRIMPQIKLHEEARRWMDRLGVADDIELLPLDGDGGRLYETKMRIKGTAYDASLADVGVGVSQVLPVIVQLYFAPYGSLLLFEQPEIHLHPSVQAALADLFIEATETMGHQVIIESHSEHFLVRMQRRIAEATTSIASRDNIKLFVCSIEKKASVAKELEMDEYGKIHNWPEDFFGDTLGDREAIMREIIRRRRGRK